MNSETPPTLESLDAEVRRVTAENLERQGVVTGWVMCVASSRFDDDGQVAYAYDYVAGTDTDLVRAVGLLEVARIAMHRDLLTTGGDA